MLEWGEIPFLVEIDETIGEITGISKMFDTFMRPDVTVLHAMAPLCTQNE